MSFYLFQIAISFAIAALGQSIGNEELASSHRDYNCIPDQSCWPSDADWRAFNATLSGRLRATVMLGSPCFPSSSDYNKSTCATILANYNDGDFREQTYGAMAYTEWESCGDANCFPSQLAPQSNICSLGRMSAYYVDAEVPTDVQATLQFTNRHNIRLSIKNTGHDFLGRSSASNTLALRTANMKRLEYRATFAAYNCPKANQENVGIIGAGVVAHEAVDYFLTHGMDVTVGACPTVGIAGGFGQSGGHGVFGPSYGLMVDQAIEFDVVTADGIIRTINECNDPDLFWAMRGGGGGTYAVLLAYKFKVYPKKSIGMYTFRASIPHSELPSNVTQSRILSDFLTTLASNQIAWSSNGMAGYDFFTGNSIETHQMLPGNSHVMENLKSLTKQWSSFTSNYPGLEVIQNNYTHFENQSAYEFGTRDIIKRNNYVGIGALPASRLVPRTQFETAERIDTLVGGILKGMDASRQLNQTGNSVAFGIYKVTPANTPDKMMATSANLAWRSALWHVIVDGGWAQDFTSSDINKVQKYVRKGLQGLSDILPVQASYTNEADYGEPSWQRIFFGQHYERLLAVKKRYDPTTLFNCWKCVGWLGAENQMYSCYGKDPQPSLSWSMEPASY
ncbi:hypothetical protein ACHAQJ_001204 [Trichoderma viride]